MPTSDESKPSMITPTIADVPGIRPIFPPELQPELLHHIRECVNASRRVGVSKELAIEVAKAGLKMGLEREPDLDQRDQESFWSSYEKALAIVASEP